MPVCVVVGVVTELADVVVVVAEVVVLESGTSDME
jgi:hypothetical protein